MLVEMQNASGGGGGLMYTKTGTETGVNPQNSRTVSTGLNSITRLFIIGETPNNMLHYIYYDSTRSWGKQVAVCVNKANTSETYGKIRWSTTSATGLLTGPTQDCIVITGISGGDFTVKASVSGFWDMGSQFTWYAE